MWLDRGSPRTLHKVQEMGAPVFSTDLLREALGITSRKVRSKGSRVCLWTVHALPLFSH
jgi:hypothetical protein